MSTDGETRPAARLTVLAGPSGSGRESVVELVRARFPSVWIPVPATTRPRREPEVDGEQRVFLAPAEFERRVATGDLLEWSRIGAYHRGTLDPPLRARLDAGQTVLLPLDVPGARLVRARVPAARLVLLIPPGHRPDAAVAAAFAHTLTHDHTDRVADELVGLLGSSYPDPAWSRVRG